MCQYIMFTSKQMKWFWKPGIIDSWLHLRRCCTTFRAEQMNMSHPLLFSLIKRMKFGSVALCKNSSSNLRSTKSWQIKSLHGTDAFTYTMSRYTMKKLHILRRSLTFFCAEGSATYHKVSLAGNGKVPRLDSINARGPSYSGTGAVRYLAYSCSVVRHPQTHFNHCAATL